MNAFHGQKWGVKEVRKKNRQCLIPVTQNSKLGRSHLLYRFLIVITFGGIRYSKGKRIRYIDIYIQIYRHI